MKRIVFLYIFTVLVISCSTDKQTNDSVPFIDVRKKYPEKEIILTSIADITYVHLDIKKTDFLYKGKINYVTKNTIVIADQSSGSILFFSKDGTPKTRFNHYGSGPEEYSDVLFAKIIYDEVDDDVYINCSGNDYINVYSSNGKYKRKLILPQGVNVQQMVLFDDQSLLVSDYNKMFQRGIHKLEGNDKIFINQTNDSTLFHISKKDGEILRYVELPQNNIDLMFVFSTVGDAKVHIPFDMNIVKCNERFLLCIPETDTIYHYRKNEPLSSILCKTPLVNNLENRVILDNCLDVGKYHFIATRTLSSENGIMSPLNYYVLDKQTNEVFRQNIILSEYRGFSFYISSLTNTLYHENEFHFELDLIELKEAYRENRLSGKLKDLVGTLDEEKDNDVIMFVHFK